MRALILVLSCITMFGVVTAEELRLKDVKDLVAEYVSEETSSSRRMEIAEKLKPADKAFLSKALKSHVKSEEKRELALDLALSHRVPGLWSSLKKYIDGDYEDMIIEYGLWVQDKGAVDFLVKRWNSLDEDQPSFAILHKAFQEHPLPYESLESFYELLDGERKDQAFAILSVQLSIEEVKDIKTLKADWEHLFQNLKVYGQEIKMKGVNLLEEAALDGYNVRKIRSNYYLKKKGELAILDYFEKLATGDWTVKFHVYVVEGDGAEVVVGSEQGVWHPETSGDEWLLKTGKASSFSLPLKRKEWLTIEFAVVDRSEGTLKDTRTVTIKVDGKPFTTDGLALNGELTHLLAYTGEDCEMIVGGIELIEK